MFHLAMKYEEIKGVAIPVQEGAVLGYRLLTSSLSLLSFSFPHLQTRTHFTHTRAHAYTYSLSHSVIYADTHSLLPSLPPSLAFTHSLSLPPFLTHHSPTLSLTRSLTHIPTHALLHSAFMHIIMKQLNVSPARPIQVLCEA